MHPTSRTRDEQLRTGWTPRRIGREIRWFDQVASTNSEVLDASAQTPVDGLVILAEQQTAGRGRQGRTWLSPRGASILCSVAVIENIDAIEAAQGRRAEESRRKPRDANAAQTIAGRLTVLAAVAACEAIAQVTEIRPAIKWPNDLRINGKKLGGILIESKALSGSVRAWVLGFGINCLQHAGHFPPEIAPAATSLELAASHAIDRVAVARALLMRLDQRLSRSDWPEDPELHEAWLTLAEPIGQRINLRYQQHDYTGRTVAVDPFGGLTLQLDNGRQMWFDPMLTSVL